MKLQFYKYQGTGNDFIMIDNRTLFFPKDDVQLINKLCDRRFGIGADGLILLEPSEKEDFTMVYFNADGNEGSMCGNGGRCLVAFAKQLNVIQNETTFDAVDGLHYATINNGIVSLKMIDVHEISTNDSDLFLNTGSPHHIQFCESVKAIPVKETGAKIRYGAPYFEAGTNVNFAEQVSENSFKVRTYERGVEDETLACGTGVTAVAIAANNAGKTTKNTIQLEVLGGNLEVSFDKNENNYTNVFLKGPAEFVFEGTVLI
ncbi:diaminopimelate epimerase [Lutibacter holmesii]|uniref:Diaminopimelate epimerase n=1 Tax=Lutibacter holmesii TaxID=1137985 RepID=A0ABW3WPY3_9FLAO